MKRLIHIFVLLLIALVGCKQEDVGPDVASKLVGNYQIWDFKLTGVSGTPIVKGYNVTLTKKTNNEIHCQVGYFGSTGNFVSLEEDLSLVEEHPLTGTENIKLTGQYTTGNANPGNAGTNVKHWLYLRVYKDGDWLSVNAKSFL